MKRYKLLIMTILVLAPLIIALSFSFGGAEKTTRYYPDNDKDGYGSKTGFVDVKEGDNPPEGYVTNCNDCNDNDPSIHPGATEICNNKDDNCNGEIDEGFAKHTYYRD